VRKERKGYSAGEKVAILRRHLLDKVPVVFPEGDNDKILHAALCWRRESQFRVLLGDSAVIHSRTAVLGQILGRRLVREDYVRELFPCANAEGSRLSKHAPCSRTGMSAPP
jgi:phosphotransacetylase